MRERRLARAIVALPGPAMRRDYVVDALEHQPLEAMAEALDALGLGAEQGDEQAKEALVAVVDALNDPRAEAVLTRLREYVASTSLVTLDRFVRLPARPWTPSVGPRSQHPPDYGYGRPLTLGERKSLAKRPDRNTIERLLKDPHPDVIRGVLRNPRLTEPDVVRFVARTPNHPDVLAEVARSPRWAHRSRVRLALVLNPFAPLDLALPLAGLLLRHELKLVVQATTVLPALRAASMEHLRRKYPHPADDRSMQ